jgi:hypothetical protein
MKSCLLYRNIYPTSLEAKLALFKKNRLLVPSTEIKIYCVQLCDEALCTLTFLMSFTWFPLYQ